jgi:hypothetical protein
MTTSTTTRRPPAGLARAVLAGALALVAAGAVDPAVPVAAIGGICPPGSPTCGPERIPGCPPGHPNCGPETLVPGADGGGSRSGYGGLGPARIGGICRPSSPTCGPDT